VTAQPVVHCRNSIECESTPGTFFLTHDFGSELEHGTINCSQQVTVAATDLTLLHASGEPQAPVQISSAVCVPGWPG
jgi:hypothetical protein